MPQLNSLFTESIVMRKSIRKLTNVIAFATGTFMLSSSLSAMTITEWMYNPNSGSGEFIEFTNLTNAAIDMTGWSFDDSSRTAGSVSLSAFGIVAAGESVILTEISAAAFRTEWNLASGVKVVGNNTDNLGRSDEINLYNNVGTLVDRLTYNDQGAGNVDGPRTQGVSGWASTATALGANNASLWVLSAVGDVEGSYTSASGLIGNPGTTAYASPVPVPAALPLLLSAFGVIGGVRLRRKA